jgi:L-alanine-DL-glutamate epimerase-like enolase superfamily enzyme
VVISLCAPWLWLNADLAVRKELIPRECVVIVQLDVDRCRGLTEARNIVSLAQAFNLPVVPNAPVIHNVHLILSHDNIPLVEVFTRPGAMGTLSSVNC